MLNKLIGMLGLCKNAGQLIAGFDPVAESVRAQKAKIILLAADISPRTKKEVAYLIRDTEIPSCTVALTLDEMDFYIGKRAGVLCTEDENFARALLPLSRACAGGQ